MVVQRNRLPNPKHPKGYTPAQIDAIFPGSAGEVFHKWMGSQTMALSDEGEAITYVYDVERYVRALKDGRTVTRE